MVNACARLSGRAEASLSRTLSIAERRALDTNNRRFLDLADTRLREARNETASRYRRAQEGH